MAFGAKESIALMLVHCGTEEKTQNAAHFVVQFAFRIFPFTNESLVGISQIIVVVSIGLSHGQSIGPCTKFQVQSVFDSLFCIVSATPIGDNHAIELPIAFQNLIEQNVVVAVVLIAIEVVSSHDTPSMTLCNRCTESRKIDFMERTIVNYYVHLMSKILIIVQCIVLDACCNTFRLQALNVWHYHAGSQPRVFSHIFKVATIERCAIDIHAWTQNHGLVAIKCFFPQTLTIEPCHLRIPCCSQARQGRESYAGVVGLSCLFPLIPKHVGTHTVRSIVSPEVGET